MPQQRLRRHRFGPLSFALIAAFLLIAVPAPALAEQADLAITGEVTGGSGTQRVAKFTLTNKGPDAADVRSAPCSPPGCNIGMDFVPHDAEIISVNPCGPTNNFVTGQGRRNCGYGKYLAAGASVSATVQLKVTGPQAQITGQVYYSDGCNDCQPNDPSLLQDPNPNNNTVYLDLDPPQTKITKEPKPRISSKADAPGKLDTATAKYKFRSDEPGSKFQCKLDKKRWKRCSSPKTFKGLDEGKHKFKVRAIDASGNRDPTPAKDTFKVVD